MGFSSTFDGHFKQLFLYTVSILKTKMTLLSNKVNKNNIILNVNVGRYQILYHLHCERDPSCNYSFLSWHRIVCNGMFLEYICISEFQTKLLIWYSCPAVPMQISSRWVGCRTLCLYIMWNTWINAKKQQDKGFNTIISQLCFTICFSFSTSQIFPVFIYIIKVKDMYQTCFKRTKIMHSIYLCIIFSS